MCGVTIRFETIFLILLGDSFDLNSEDTAGAIIAKSDYQDRHKKKCLHMPVQLKDCLN